MTLHLQKLCVGCDSPEDLRGWIDERMAERRRTGRPEEQIHTTRMTPKRADDVLDGGSLYWVIKGAILIRQPILALRPAKGADGIERCDIVLSPETIAVRPSPRRAFQGWRYLPAHEAPADVSVDQLAAPGLPPALVAELRTLGLLQNPVAQVFSPLDAAAVVVFLAAWALHHILSERSPKSLNAVMARRRREWMGRMSGRDARMPDSITMQGLQNGTAFFASTSLIAVGGGLAALRASREVVEVFAELPFGIATTTQVYEAKVLGFCAIFVYAFFKFVWSYRLFNYCSILVVATPPPAMRDTREMEVAVERAARMNIEGGRHFNRGLRALFFVLAYLGWFVSPVVLIASSMIVFFVLYRRQFASEPMRAAGYGDE